MKEKLNIIHWVLVADVLICIISHRILLAQAEKGQVSDLVADVLQITIFGAILFIMATFAGIAVWLWNKMNVYGNVSNENREFPVVSFVAAVIATIVYSIYWML